MAFREVTMLEIKEVLRRWLRGESKSAIARQCGVSRGTVKSYIKAAEQGGVCPSQPENVLEDAAWLAGLAARLHPESGRPRGEGWDRCQEQRSFIAERLARGIRLTKIRKLLRRQQGALVSYATLRRFAISELGFNVGEPTIPVSDGEPGKELQLDTGWVGSLKPDLWGRRRRFRAWIFTPGVSRYRFVYPVFEETTQTAIAACEAAWQFYGGSFDVLIPDNTKTIVQEADPLQPIFNLAFLEYAQARGFVIDAARVQRAKDKGRVERTVRVVSEDCFAGEELLDLEHARQHARQWCSEENGLTRHRATRRFPREHFEAEERPRLHAPPSEPYDMPLWCEPKVHPDQHAQVDKALYSLPSRFRGHWLKARADRTTVRFYEGRAHKLVKVHPRVAPGKRQTDPADFPPEKAAYAMRDVAFLLRKAAKHGAAVRRYAEALLDSRLPWTRMRQVYALLGFAKRYGSTRLDQACQAALEVELIDIYRLRRLLELAPASSGAPSPPTSNRVVPLARFLRPASQFALSFPSLSEDTKGEQKA